jgi:DNA repair exonuclease SbcCD nuclease subunit
MKALITADWHLSNTLPHAQRAPDTLISDRLKDLQKTTDWIFKAAADRKLPLVILGDVFDRRQPDAPTLKAAAKVFSGAAKLGVEVYILPGNHDAHDTRGLHYVVDFFAALGVADLRVMKAGVVEELDNGSLLPVPSMAKKPTIELIREYRKQKIKNGILLLHDTIIGAQMNGGHVADAGIPKDELKGFKYVLSGHIHEFQTLSPIKGCYLGSPYQVTGFNEARHKPSIGLLSTEGSKVSFHRVTVPEDLSQWFQEVRLNEDGNLVKTGRDGAPYYRLVYEGSEESLDIHREELDAMMAEAKPSARSVSFIHRDVPGAGRGRLDIDLVADGVPPLETLVTEYVDLHRPTEGEAFAEAGLDLLRGLK